ncbi:MAG: methyltransferase domain-containing protein [Sterolibacterium sp.]
MRINIGCGQTPTKGWRNFDNSVSVKLSKVPLVPEFLLRLGVIDQSQYEFIQFCRSHSIEYGNATKGLPIPDGQVDVLYSSHMFEHLDQQEAVLFLKEARRVLRSKGIIRIAVPDIRVQVQQYLETKDADQLISGTFLTMPRPRTISSRVKMILVGTRHHQWMYDGASLSRFLKVQGFAAPAVLKAGETHIDNPENLDLHERCSESVYVEAVNP